MKTTNTQPYRIVAWQWHWKFWSPVQCVDQRLKFGPYATMSQPGSDVVIRDTPSQVAMKQRLGVIE
jgi:hypothetical protein